MCGMWGGSGLPSISTFLFWFLPVFSFPVSGIYFVLPRMAVAFSWLLLFGTYAAYFFMLWQSALAGNSTTTNPFVIAWGCLYGSPTVPALFVVAVCINLAARIDRLSKALNVGDFPGEKTA
jgi:hypothetical protein